MRGLKRAGRILAGLLLLYAVCSAGIYVAMLQPPEHFGAIMAHVPMVAMMVLPFEPLWMSARAGKLHDGDPSPDFTLPRQDQSGSVTLSAETRDRPVVLIFGSYT